MLRRWARVAQIMAMAQELIPDGLGRALADADVSDLRVGALLNARGDALYDLASRVARRIANGGVLPYRELAALILLDDIQSHDDALEQIRIGIMADFQRHKEAA